MEDMFVVIEDNPDGLSSKVTREFTKQEKFGRGVKEFQVLIGIKRVPKNLVTEYADMLTLYDKGDSELASKMTKKFIEIIKKQEDEK